MTADGVKYTRIPEEQKTEEMHAFDAKLLKQQKEAAQALADAAPVPRLPRQVRVGPFWYKVYRDPAEDAHSHWAEVNRFDRTMRFSTQAPPEQVAVTFLHEILHIVHWEIDQDDDEKETFRMAELLAPVLQDLGFWPTRLKLAEDP